MTNDELLKVLIGVTSAFAGWMLAQFTSAAKTWFQRRKIKKLLLEELGDIALEVNRVLLSYARDLQIFGAKGIGRGSAASISNYIFKNYYKDALLSLNQKQRISYQLIHTLVGNLNSGLEEVRELAEEARKIDGQKHPQELAIAGQRWGIKVKGEYLSCAALQWQITFHLENQKKPDLSPYTEHHKAYLQFLENAEKEADRTIDTGKSIPREKFDKAYNPESFPKR